MKSNGRRIAIAMSGGVDSSVAASLLARSGARVFGIMLRLWSGGPGLTNRCCSPADMARARAVAGDLEIPFYVIDVQDRFKEEVVDFFMAGYEQGLTPNPCLECNRSIRWDFMLKRALALGATHLATGHYARVAHTENGYELLRAADRHKDQSYVLSVLGQPQLKRAVFPLGERTKQEVRAYAVAHGMAVADRAESQDLCFLGDLDYREFLALEGAELPPPGPIVNRAGEVLGTHPGLASFTIGQRKGIGVSAPEPLYVVEKVPESNSLIVGPKNQLERKHVELARVNWTGNPAHEPFKAGVQIRYRSPEVPATVTPLSTDSARIDFEIVARGVSPGQVAVIYQGDRCLAGGIIQP